MNRLLFLSILFFAMILSNSTVAQPTGSAPAPKFYQIELNADEPCFVKTIRIDVAEGDSIQFTTTNGDFGVYIINASNFLSIKEQDLKLIVNSSNPTSEIYHVIKPTNDAVIFCSIFCITTLSWPDAPPRIIVTP